MVSHCGVAYSQLSTLDNAKWLSPVTWIKLNENLIATMSELCMYSFTCITWGKSFNSPQHRTANTELIHQIDIYMDATLQMLDFVSPYYFFAAVIPE